jgi:hypothetical protein
MGRTRMNHEENVTYNGLPVLMADDDFIEHLHELGFTGTIDVNELALAWLDWSKENVAKK